MHKKWVYSAVARPRMPWVDVFSPVRADPSCLVHTAMVKLKPTMWMSVSKCVLCHGAPLCKIWCHSLTIWSFDHRKEGVSRPETLYLGCTCTMALSTTNNSCTSQQCKCVSWHCAPLCQIWGHSAFACHWMPGVDVFCADKLDTGCLVHTAIVKMKQTM